MFQCPSCGLREFAKYILVDKYRISRCRNCGILCTEVKSEIVEANNVKTYSQKYASEYKNNLPRIRKRYQRYLSLFSKYNIKGKLLDIGCGTGYFIHYVLDTANRNLKVFGVEPNNELREIACRNTGIDVRIGKMNSIPYPKNYFDVLSCLDVLEHSVNLKENIIEIRRVIKPKGAILIQAPNYVSLMAILSGNKWDWWSPPDHTVHFSVKSLNKFLTSNGFTIIKNYTYEDTSDFILNVKGRFSKNVITKIIFYSLLPLLIVLERFSWLINKGGLVVVLAQKE